VGFPEILQETRDQALTETTILKAWEKAGLFPLWRPSTPPPASNPSSKPSICTLNEQVFTPKNTMEVEDLVNRVLEGEDLNPAIALRFEKLSKVHY
jgi:hypothetical protein